MKTPSRLIILLAGLVLCTVCGVLYAWSIFVVPLEQAFGWQRPETVSYTHLPLMLICVPIFLPLAALFGWNLIWFGVIINILVTMAGMTPPFGVSLFVAKELADVPLSLVYRSSIPFVLAFFLCLGFCIAFEPLSTRCV